MTVLALMLTAALLLIAVTHAAWGVGIVRPAADETSLARTVVGAKGVTRMPSPVACFSVAVVLLAIACWPLWRVGMIGSPLPERPSLLAGSAIAGGLAARGFASYVPAWRRLVPEEPFATLDRALYGPLCLLLAAGFAVLRMIGGE